MLELGKQISVPGGLIVADPTSFKSKITEFAALGASGLHVIFDFDRTLTVKRPDTQDEVTTWAILQEYLPEDGRLEYKEVFEKYRALELSGEMTQQDAVDWWSASLNLFVEHRIDLAAIEETFLERASIRPGTIELFELCVKNNIPTVILSAGVRDVIDIWCRKYDIHPTLVISTELTVDSKKVITGWKRDTLVHILNKSEATHPELLAIRKSRSKVIVVGDSLDDAAMATDSGDVIKVRMLDPRSDEIVTDHEERKTFERFDSLIKTGTFDPLNRLIERII